MAKIRPIGQQRVLQFRPSCTRLWPFSVARGSQPGVLQPNKYSLNPKGAPPWRKSVRSDNKEYCNSGLLVLGFGRFQSPVALNPGYFNPTSTPSTRKEHLHGENPSDRTTKSIAIPAFLY